MKICNECPKQDLGRYEPIPRPPIDDCNCDLTQFYTKEEVDSLLKAIETGQFVIVDELPVTGNPKNIYLVPKASGGYTEYAFIGGEPVSYPCQDFRIYSNNDERFASDGVTVNGNVYPIDDGEYKVTICDQEYTCSLEYKEQETDTLLVYGISCDELRIDFTYFSDTDTTEIHLNTFYKPSCVEPTDIPSEEGLPDAYKYTLDNVCIEKVGGKWEEIGDTDIDLSDYYTKEEVDVQLEEKQDKLTQGENITIQDNVISAKDTTYTGGDNVSISSENVISVDLDNYVTQSALDSVLDTKQDKLTAGDNVDITNNVVSVDLSEYATKTEVTTLETTLRELIDTKQDKLTKQDILDLLGYVEMPMSMEDEDGTTVDVLVIGKVV